MLYMAYNIPIAHGKNDKNEIKTVMVWIQTRIFFCTEQLAGGYTTIDNMPYGIYDVKI
jgi:hypothetical protein